MKNIFGPSLTFILIIAIAACGAPDTSQPVGQAGAPSVNGEPETSADVADAAMSAVLEAVEESASEPTETQTAAEETIVLADAAPVATPTSPASWKYNAEKHFTILTTAQGTSSPPDLIEVTEVFWYGCPHCFNLDPYLKKWTQTLPDDVNFVRMPVIWNPTNKIHARLFYTAESLGKLDEMHEAIFREMHLNQNMLSTEADILELFQSFGVTEEEFDKTFRSFSVESKLKRAKNLTQRYQIRSVPLLVINGKYLTQGPEIKNFDVMLSVTDELVERERETL